MKTLKYTLILCFLWLLACQKQEGTVTPNGNTTSNTNTNNTNNNTNTTTSWALTTTQGKEAYNEIIRLVFKTADGANDKNVVKWTENSPKIQVYFDGAKDAALTKAFDGIIAELTTINKVNTFEVTTKATDAEIIINKDSFENHNAKYPNAKVPSSGIAGYTVYTYSSVTGLSNATIWLNPMVTGTNLLYILRHEFTHSLGLGHTSNINSIMYGTANAQYNNANYAPLDKKILEIMFDKRIKQNMTLSQADAIIKEYLK